MTPQTIATLSQWAYQWVSRILGVVLMMVGPGIAGDYLGKKWDSPLLAPLGFGIGLVLGGLSLYSFLKEDELRRKQDKDK